MFETSEAVVDIDLSTVYKEIADIPIRQERAAAKAPIGPGKNKAKSRN